MVAPLELPLGKKRTPAVAAERLSLSAAVTAMAIDRLSSRAACPSLNPITRLLTSIVATRSLPVVIAAARKSRSRDAVKSAAALTCVPLEGER
jgi:hypothetical protein